VLLADFFATASRDAADALGVPVVTVFPNPLGMTGLLAPELRGIGGHLHASLASFGEELTARLLRWLRNRERGLRQLEPLVEQDVYPSAAMPRPMIVMTAIGYEYARPMPPLAYFVGPSPPLTKAALQPALAEWLEAQSKPVVYVAFGTVHVFKQRECRELHDALLALSDVASVLWSLPKAQQALLMDTEAPSPLPASSASLRIENFVPQWEVLCHAKTSVFVSHCGANSTMEALLAGVPMVCSPKKADQPANAARVCSAGCGVRLSNGARGVHTAVRRVLKERQLFEPALGRMRSVLMAAGGAVRAAQVLEHTAAHGYSHLQAKTPRASWCRACMVVLLFLGAGAGAACLR